MFGGIVRSGDVTAFDGIDQQGPMAFQEVKERCGVRPLRHESLPLSQHLVVAPLGRAFGARAEDAGDLVLESRHIRVAFGIVRAVDFFEALVNYLQGVEDALVVDGLGEDLGDDISVVNAHVGDDDTGVIAFCAQGQEEGAGSGGARSRSKRRKTSNK